MKIDLKSLAMFSDLMAQCLSSGMSPAKSLRLSAGESPCRRLRHVVTPALERLREGMPLSEALEPSHSVFPRFFIPVLRCGEEGGRPTETFQYLADYCHRLLPQVQILRKTWLYPLCIIFFGWIVQLLLFLVLGRRGAAGYFMLHTFLPAGLIVAGGAAALHLSPVRTLYDTAKLFLPLVSETQIAAGTNTFLKAFSVLYQAGGTSPARMVALAADSVENTALRKDILRACTLLDRRHSFADAFRSVTWLGDAYKHQIETGEESGKLDTALDKATEMSVNDLEFRLSLFNQFFQRLTSLTVIGAIAETAVVILMSMSS